MSKSQFATVINCMDGRAQLPAIKWMQGKYEAPYIDTITEAGAEKVLLFGSEKEIDAIKSKVLISKNAHGSTSIAIIGHHDCAGNPIPRDAKWDQIKKCVDLIQNWNLEMEVIGLYVNENFEVEQVM